MKAEDIKLIKTCDWCPEQYDAFVGEIQVGYLRLRSGYFSVEAPKCQLISNTVFEAEPEGDGSFEDDEREHYLAEAKKSIAKWLNETQYLNAQKAPQRTGNNMILEVGKTYKVSHDRKGSFTVRVTSQCDTWTTGIITKGKTLAMCDYNKADEGESVTFRSKWTRKAVEIPLAA